MHTSSDSSLHARSHKIWGNIRGNIGENMRELLFARVPQLRLVQSVGKLKHGRPLEASNIADRLCQ